MGCGGSGTARVPVPCSSRPGAACGGAGVWLRLAKEARSCFPLGQGELALQQPSAGRAWQGAHGKTNRLCPLLRPAAPELSHGVGDLEFQKRKMQCHSHPALASLTHYKGQEQHPFPSAAGLAVRAVPQSLQSVLGWAAGTGNKVVALHRKPSFLRCSLRTGGSVVQ